MTTLVTLESSAGVATITLDSPSNRNALSADLVAQLLAHLATAGDDPAVRSVVLTHTGGTFCAGADLAGALGSGMSPEEASAAGAKAMVSVMRTILELPRPVVARVDGHVRAGGIGLLGACDIVVAGPASTFALTEARLGLAPSVISLTLLSRMTSRSVGRYFVTGEKFGAAEAESMGLVTVAAADAETSESTARGILDAIGKGSPQGLRESKKVATAQIRAEFERFAEDRTRESAALFASDEAREGMTAFLEKRPPRWAVTEPAAT